MSLKQQLIDDMKQAMKSGDTLTRDTIRTLNSAIKNVEIDTRKDLTDEETLAVIAKQAKQRRDSITEYEKANRPDLSEQEAQELGIIEIYLPQQLSDAEITTKAEAVIATLSVSNMKGMGLVMKQLTTDLKGVADGKRISAIVRDLLKE